MVRMLSTLFIAAILLCGCSSTKFTEHHGSTVIQGKGGTMEAVDDIDFWEKGEPARKYRILGVITVNHQHMRLPGRLNALFSSSGDEQESVAKLAHKKGGDAVITVSKDRDSSNDLQDGEEKHRQPTKFIVIKYMD